MKRLSKGMRVVQINKDYPTTKIGWKGTVISTDVLYALVQFEKNNIPLMVYKKDLRILSHDSFITYKPVNHPETAE